MYSQYKANKFNCFFLNNLLRIHYEKYGHSSVEFINTRLHYIWYTASQLHIRVHSLLNMTL